MTSKYYTEQAKLLKTYSDEIKQATTAKTRVEQWKWYTKACLTANQLKTLTVKQVYLRVDEDLEAIENHILIPANSQLRGTRK